MGRAEDHRIPEEIALMPQEPDAAKAEVYIERALVVARDPASGKWIGPAFYAMATASAPAASASTRPSVSS